MIELASIVKSAMSPSEFFAGQKLAEGRGVTIEREDSFWRGEHNVTATVREADACCTVVFNLSGDHIKNCRCDCHRMETVDPVTGLRGRLRGLCRHGVAAVLAYTRRTAIRPEQPVTTSFASKMLLQKYAERNAASDYSLGLSAPVTLRPYLVLAPMELRIGFHIGREKFYILKDLAAFSKALEQGELVEYGKSLCFPHVKEAFSKQSGELAECISTMMKRRGQTAAWGSSSGIRELSLDRHMADEVMELLVGEELEVRSQSGQGNKVSVLEENPSLKVVIRKKGKDGAEVALPENIWALEGRRHAYVYDGKVFYVTDAAFLEAAGLFLAAVCGQRQGKNSLDFQKADLITFCGEVLPGIRDFFEVIWEELDPDEYEPMPLHTEIFLDEPENGLVVCRLRQSYGEESFNPVTEEFPAGIRRDLIQERRVRRILAAYFPYRDEEGNLLIREDEELLYQLLKEGMPKLLACADVYATEAFHQLKIRNKTRVSLGVRVESGLLNLSLDLEGVKKEELAGLLASYQEKKKYHRLKNGDFLSLEDSEGISLVKDLAQAMGLGKKELEQEELHLGQYWSLYLNEMASGKEEVSFRQDQSFRETVQKMKDPFALSFPISESFSSILRPYQAMGYRWLKLLEAYGFGGILADDMGLGKSLQTIALLGDQKGTSLIVCPASLIYNWQNEFEKFAPWMKVLPVLGNAKERKELLKEAEHFDVLITSYDLLRRDVEEYEQLRFSCMAIDEAQYIKNNHTQNASAVKSVQAKLRLALTGTPVENRLSELWSIFDYLMPGFLGSYSSFRERFELPVAKGEEEALERLRRVTGPFILRRKKKEVLKELPDKMEHVVYARLSPEQKKLYQASALSLKEHLENTEEEAFGREKLQVLAHLLRMRQLCCDPGLCLENYTGGSGKLDTCLELIEDSIEGGHKILLFSQFTTMLDRIGEELNRRKISYHMLTGATPKEKRMAMVKSFEKDEVPIFLISLKAGGTGLNLTAADVVIHYDPWWNQAAQNQATDRAHRIGQDKVVSVYRLIARHTIEERILQLQNKKMDLAEQVLEDNQVSMEKMTKQELLSLLEEEL